MAEENVGMLAVGLGPAALEPYLAEYKGDAWVACYNSPSSLTISGRRSALECLQEDIKSAGHFARLLARLLQVDLAYHSELMHNIGEEYEQLLGDKLNPLPGSQSVSMFSSVTGSRKTDMTDSLYWKTNMVSPVLFNEATKTMLSQENAPNFLIEIGPSGALAGPISQIKQSLPSHGASISYCAAWSRGNDAAKALFDVAGRLFVAGSFVELPQVNQYSADERPRTIIDLPNYVWNHSIKYWHENQASKDWRFKKYVTHDLLGSKVLGTSWRNPTWRKTLNLADVPWLKDHKMGTDVLMPGSGFIAIGLEAMFQKSKALDEEGSASLSPNDLCYRFRNVRFDKALVLEEGKDATIMVSLTSQPGSKDWHEFRVSSLAGEATLEHCHGLVRVQDSVDEPLEESRAKPFRYPTNSRLWYKAQSEIGYGFGPAFEKLLQIESTSGQRQARSIVSLTPPPSKWSPQSYYPVHPAALDGCFQTVTPALWAGERSSLNAVVVPSLIDSLIINKVPANLQEGLSVANSQYSGRGRLEEAKSYFANCSVHDPTTGALLVQLSGLRFAKLDTGPKTDPHTFDRISWKPDITFLTQDQLDKLPAPTPDDKIQLVLDLIAHKKPRLRVLEVVDSEVSSTFWLDGGDKSSRTAYAAYTFACFNPKSIVSVQTKHETSRDTDFHLLDSDTPLLGLPKHGDPYDLVIIRSPEKPAIGVDDMLASFKSRLAAQPFVLVVQSSGQDETTWSSESNSGSDGVSEGPQTPTRNESMLPAVPGVATPASSVSGHGGSGDTEELEGKWRPLNQDVVVAKTQPRLFGSDALNTLEVASGHPVSAYFSMPKDAAADRQPALRTVCIVRLTDATPTLPPSLLHSFSSNKWHVTEQLSGFNLKTLCANTDAILILDELWTPLLSCATPAQWSAIQALASSGKQLLWVTQGSQLSRVTNPEKALAQGLFRVARMENPSARLATLDVTDADGPATGWAIETMLRALVDGQEQGKAFVDSEFAEEGGVVYVHRIVPDEGVNAWRKDERKGAEAVIKGLHGTKVPVSLRAERMGTFQGLVWAETSTEEVVVDGGKVEVEVMAAGVNFKDVAVTMGIVPENEYTLGYEAAGVVRRLGPGVSKFKEGDRVCFLNNGSYANRLQIAAGRAHVIPDWMSFEEAATIPSVYLASIYSLFDIANLKEGQSVLIHSASGGVGLSAIQLAQYKKAKIFVTVGTEEKRNFLIESHGIDPSRIFSSRNTDFAKSILQLTDGRGVDVILNSLTGEMLDESWRICADGGTFVEIGKKDIVDRNTLSLEPFDRNCSFRAMDFSYTKDISDSLIDRLLDEIFDLINAGHVKPIYPITSFGFDDIPSALAHIRSGRHMGKVIISSGVEDVQVPIRPAVRKLALRSDASYLIVGGLKGLCGNLAIHMAQHGARQIIVCSRSGLGDEASQKTVENCLSYGCQVIAAKGDVADEEFVRSIFQHASPPIAGVIQGAMILRDKPFETMSHADYHLALHAKIHGTFALHHASLHHPWNAFASFRQHTLNLPANAVDLSLIEDVGSGNGGGGAGGGEGAGAGDQALRVFKLMRKSGGGAAELAVLAQELLAGQFTRILRLETAMEPAKPLMAYGLDSLAAVELRNWVRSELGAELTTLDITNASSLIALGEKLIAKLP
ncbi:hypothetical protein N0V88_005718 [Collariella sp. IMI 366227]|nr:hypothetical protein N0V88_005718 [Collariella sp. IMI 366227]